MKYRKTALVEAVQYNGQPIPGVCTGECVPGSGGYAKDTGPHIHGLEGDHSVTVGDWILTGIQGEKWACKPGIFATTYEPAAEHSTPYTKDYIEIAREVLERVHNDPNSPCMSCLEGRPCKRKQALALLSVSID